jgi:hypothetical protein
MTRKTDRHQAASMKKRRMRCRSSFNILGLFLLDCAHVATGETSKDVQFSMMRD